MNTAIKHRRGIKRRAFKCAILTISSSKYREKEKDTSGSLMKEILEENGHEVIYKGIVPDDLAKIKDEVVQLLECDTDFIVATGGTGLTKDDVTIEVVAPLIEKEMPGFGEILRLRSYERIGSAAILTRALAGKIGDKAIFCLPGSPGAVELALREIIVPEIAHIMRHIRE